MKLRRFLFLGGAFLLLVVKFTLDIVGKNVDLELREPALLREATVLGAFVLLYFIVDALAWHRQSSPVRTFGLMLIVMGGAFVTALALSAIGVDGFDAKSMSLVPRDYPTIFVASLLSLTLGTFAVIVFRLLRDLVLANRKAAARRNWLLFTVFALASAVSVTTTRPLDSTWLNGILFGVSVFLGLVNAFRLPWIVYLTKREKVFGLIFGFLLFGGFTGFSVAVGSSSFLGRSLLYYSHPLREFVLNIMVFGTVYTGMAFVSTLFHLPTAEALDRKRSEVSSLHTLGKLVTQVFDFHELVETVTSMTMQVVEASRCWLEIMQPEPGSASGYWVRVAGMKNITEEQIGQLVSHGGFDIREAIMAERKPMLIDDLEHDRRFARLKGASDLAGSIVVVPLISHTGLAGILYATKKEAFGFMKDDVELIAAFADQATIAIENARLIRESIERERLYREMLVAQEMQKRLLPQVLPAASTIELDAVSTPAFEVGGDYYDFMELDDSRIGIVVGDVSGKGVSAAFYMSEMKGIFQALARLHTSPKQFMIQANEALAESIDSHSFVSLIYVIINTRTGCLTLARAGHCPMLHISGEEVTYVRPNGLGMGLSRGAKFSGAIEEQVIDLAPGDVCVLYTDGITEARRGDEEFGYERLQQVAREMQGRNAGEIKTEILRTVAEFSEHRAHEDDLTLVVLKWKGPDRRAERMS
jgi:serine phosphatase RsbU (regulator of sigma subunit)